MLKLATPVSPLETKAMHTEHLAVLLVGFSSVKKIADILLALANVTRP